MVRSQQVHGDRVAVVPGDTGPLAATDGLVTGTPGVGLATFVADCVPVFLYDPVRRVAGIVHAGREGTCLDIGGKAIGVMREAFGCLPGDVRAVIGPSAGPCCYEVGVELAGQLASPGFPGPWPEPGPVGKQPAPVGGGGIAGGPRRGLGGVHDLRWPVLFLPARGWTWAEHGGRGPLAR